MTPERLREWLQVLLRDLIIPGAGVYLAVYLVRGGNPPVDPKLLVPMVIGMIGAPVVARGDNGEKK